MHVYFYGTFCLGFARVRVAAWTDFRDLNNIFIGYADNMFYVVFYYFNFLQVLVGTQLRGFLTTYKFWHDYSCLIAQC